MTGRPGPAVSAAAIVAVALTAISALTILAPPAARAGVAPAAGRTPGHRMGLVVAPAGGLRSSPEEEPFGGPPARAADRSRVPVGGHPAIIVPFTPSPDLRRPGPADHLPPFWADGRACSVGCRPAGVARGWPLVPFHTQHALRAGLNELRTGTMHIGIDIQARDGQRVYGIQSGRATIPQRTGGDSRVRVGAYEYWHIVPSVAEGQHVSAYRTVLGTIRLRYGHVHLSEVRGGRYLNPLRPGGRALSPYVERDPPVIGAPEFHGRLVDVAAYDPQTFVVRTTYPTPVLAPAALAYRLRTATGRPIGGLRFALRGSQHYPFTLARRIYAPGARAGGFLCFAFHPRCTPNWRYHLAGGLAPALPRLGRGLYRLTVYAWDWRGNATARDTDFAMA